MKKKNIEKIPYLKLPKTVRKKNVEYVGVTAIKEVGHEMHLFLEIYRNDKEHRETPVVRIVMTQKDFGTYFPGTGEWSRAKITRNTWDNYGLIWREEDERIQKSENIMAEENVLQSEEDLERIEKFANGIKTWNEEMWWKYIEREQEEILRKEHSEREERKRKRRQEALQKRKNQTPKLPEKRILEYADRILFHQEHYLYYKKHGARATVACSRCGRISDERWKPRESYEDMFLKLIEEPKMGAYGTCPLCGARGKYMPKGKAQGSHSKACHIFLGQKYKESGVVIRYIEVEKEWVLELICGVKEPEMHGSYEKISGIEIARAYFEPGKQVQIDYQKHNPWTGEDFWDDCNLSGLQSIRVRDAWIMPETYEEIKGTFLQYSAIEEFQKAEGEVNLVDYMERYIQTPQIEMLVKLGLVKVVKKLVNCHYGIVADPVANRVDEFLGIRKKHVKQLIRHKGDINILEVMQLEKRIGQNWTDEQIEKLEEIEIEKQQVTMALQYMTVQQLLNRIEKYAGCEYGTGRSGARERLRQITQTYFDYLGMRHALGYDLHNTVYQQPRDLGVAHTRMVHESNKEEADKRTEEVKEKFPLIRKNYRKLRKQYYYEDEEFLIRPARSAEEIVMEGRTLHHCVGGNYYLSKHNDGESIILFLRRKSEPEMPYITVEIDARSLRICQWYGANDKKPDEDRMKNWLNSYIKRLKCGAMEAGIKTGAEEANQQMLAYA